jgi:hypothetical protein
MAILSYRVTSLSNFIDQVVRLRGLDSFVSRMLKPHLVKFVIPKRVGKDIVNNLSTCTESCKQAFSLTSKDFRES